MILVENWQTPEVICMGRIVNDDRGLICASGLLRFITLLSGIDVNEVKKWHHSKNATRFPTQHRVICAPAVPARNVSDAELVIAVDF